MSLDHLRLLVLRSLLLRFVELLNKGHGLSSEPAVKLSADARGEEREKFDGFHGEEGIEVHAAEGELFESTALALGGWIDHGVVVVEENT